MTLPAITLRIAFDSDAFATAPVWSDVSTYALDFSTKRGRNTPLDQMQAGTLSATLDNRDGRFWPTNGGTVLNLVTNPSAEVDATGWDAWSATVVRSTAAALYGTASLKVTTTNVNHSGIPAAEPTYSPRITVGLTYTLSVYAALAVAASKNFHLGIAWRDGAGDPVSDSEANVVLSTTDWSQRLTVTGVAPAGAALATPYLITNGAQGVFVFYCDGWMLEQAGTASVYCDGTQTGCVWNGTAHASRSHKGGSPYWPDVLPVKRVSLQAAYGGTTYDLYTGYISEYAPTFRGAGTNLGIVTISAADLRRNLSFLALNNAGYAEQASGARIGAVLDSLGWPAADRTLATGQSTIAASGALAGVNAISHIQSVENAELGYMFIGGDGKVVWHDRYTRITGDYMAVEGVFGDDAGELPYSAIELSYNDDVIYNDVRFQRTGGTEQANEDANSLAIYGRRTLTRSGLPLTLDGSADSLAEYYLGRYKDARLRVKSITIQPDRSPAALWPLVLGLDIGARIGLRLNAAGLDADFHIEGIEHKVTQKHGWLTRWWLSEGYTENYWTIGTSQLGSGTILGY